MPFTVLIGGARSGKSGLAVRSAAKHDGPVVVLATAEARDDEMAERIRRHREARPQTWTTIEAALGLTPVVRDLPADAFVILDCLSLWVSNAIEAGLDDDAIVDEAVEAASLLARRAPPAVVVTNEVGLGIVPVNALARRYRDTLGRVNAAFADAASRSYFVVAGRALPLEDVTIA
jgi:adenosyl cobinamide kinase/adenosyl cobinamide phosphate guanylyltransferase